METLRGNELKGQKVVSPGHRPGYNISIIITCEEQQQQQLRLLLPRLLSLQYAGEYEAIVVDKIHDKDMEEWLEEIEVHHPNLCHTFCPASARGIDTHRLALTLGAKAANYEWLAILPADVKPEGEDWLRELTKDLDDETKVLVNINDRKRRWNWFTSYLFRRRFSLFRPSNSIILCRRDILLQGKNVKLSKKEIIKG